MPPRVLQTFFFLGLCLVLPREARGQSLDETAQSAAALGAALANTPTLRGPSAIWGNTALLGRADARLYVGLGLETRRRRLGRRGRLINQAPPEARDAASPQISPRVALSAPLLGRRLWLALAYRPALQLRSTHGGARNPARYQASALSLVDHRVSLGGALRLGPLRLGAAMEIDAISFGAKRYLWLGFESDKASMQLPKLDGVARASVSGVVFAARLGLAWIAAPWLTVGLSCRLPVSSSLAGALTLGRPSRPPAGYSAIAPRGGAATVTYTAPSQLTFGLSLRAHRRLSLALALRHERTSSLDDLSVNSAEAGYALTSSQTKTVGLKTMPFGLRFDDRLSIHIGLDLVIVEGFLRGRAGWAYRQGATPADAPHAAALDLDRHQLGVSLEATVAKLTLAVGVAHSLLATLQSTGERAKLFNPLDPALTSIVGQGLATMASTRLIFEAQIGW